MTHWEAMMVIASSAVAILAFLDGWRRRRSQRYEDMLATVRRIEDRLTRVEMEQFGGNHGGIRQQVDTIAATQQTVIEKLAELRGELKRR